MPKRLNTEDVKAIFERYGYTVPDNFVYLNNSTSIRVYDEQENTYKDMTYKKLQYQIKKGRSEMETEKSYAQNEVPYPFMNMALSETGPRTRDGFIDMMNMALSETGPRTREGFYDLMNAPLENEEVPQTRLDRYGKKFGNLFMRETDEFKYDVMNLSNKIIKKLMSGQPFTLNENKNTAIILYALSHAMKIAAPKINKDIIMTIVDKKGHTQYARVNQNTIDMLDWVLEDKEYEINDSGDPILESLSNFKSIAFDFRNISKGKRIVGAFFPYYNNSDIDLTPYGIYKRGEVIRESCLLTAFRSSGLLDDEQLNLLSSFLKTKLIPREELKHISNLFNIRISCRVHYDTGKTSTNEYGEKYGKTLKLHIIEDHYILDKDVNATVFYVKNYAKINNDERFVNHPRKMMLSRLDKTRYEFSKKGCTINRIIDAMIENKLLEPMTDEEKRYLQYDECSGLFRDYRKNKSITVKCKEATRQINIKDKKNYVKPGYNGVPHAYVRPGIKHNKFLFGYDVKDDEIDQRLHELQRLVDSLNLRHKINVSLYFKFSELMQKIMYEYGCLDDVYEFSGDISQKIRSELQFPKIIWSEGHYVGKLYYIDQAGAYMSSVTSIPSGMPDDDGNFKSENTKIKELIEQLYDIRMKAKKIGMDKLATTIKYMMNSSWGYSMKKPKLIKHRFVKDVDEYVKKFDPFIIKYKYNQGNAGPGYVDRINPYVESYSYPQFARSVLNTFNAKMKELCNKVNVLYSKTDSALIYENDYKKLLSENWIGEKLGLFKVEHIFTEVYVKSAEKWIGKNEDGTYFYHMSKKLKDICSKSDDPIKCLKFI